MKAYMSDPTMRPYNAADFEDDAVNAWAAMREARRILAETEPAALREDAPISVPNFMRTLSHVDNTDWPWTLMRDALAESLAAFIAAPIE
jgi:hypothetical protein